MTLEQYLKLIEEYFKQKDYFESLPFDSPEVDIEGTVLDNRERQVREYLELFRHPNCLNCFLSLNCTKKEYPQFKTCLIIDEKRIEYVPYYEKLVEIWGDGTMVNPMIYKYVKDTILVPLNNSDFNKKTIFNVKEKLESLMFICDKNLGEFQMMEQTLEILNQMQ
jgi:hypothetical protein